MDGSTRKDTGKGLYCSLDRLGGHRVPRLLGRYLAYSHRKKRPASDLYSIPLATADGSGQLSSPDLTLWNDEMYLVGTPSPFALASYQEPWAYSGGSVYGMKLLGSAPVISAASRKGVLTDSCIFPCGGCLGVVTCQQGIGSAEDAASVEEVAENADSEGVEAAERVEDAEIIQGGQLLAALSLDGHKWSVPQELLTVEEGILSSPCALNQAGQGLVFFLHTVGDEGRVLMTDIISDPDQDQAVQVEIEGLPEKAQVLGFSLLGAKSMDKSLKAKEGLVGIVQVKGDKPTLYRIEAQATDAPWRILEELPLPSYILDEGLSLERASLIPLTGDVLLSFREESGRPILCVAPGLRDRVDTSEDFLDSYRVFSNVFHSDMSYQRFLYKHQENPACVPAYFFQTKEGTQIIGTNCFMGADGKVGETELLMVQSCDTAVMPEGRGKGVFTGIIGRAETALAHEGVDLLVGFPNDSSIHGFQKMGWDHLGDLATYQRVARPLGSGRNKLGLYRAKALEEGKRKGVQISHRCPFSQEDLDLINSSTSVLFTRTPGYYRWKVDDNEAKGNLYYLTRREGEALKAFAIALQHPSGKVTVLDWWLVGEDLLGKVNNFKGIARILSRLGHTVEVPLVNKDSGEQELWEALEYTDAQRPIHFIIKPLTLKGEDAGPDLASWRLRFIDADTAIS